MDERARTILLAAASRSPEDACEWLLSAAGACDAAPWAAAARATARATAAWGGYAYHSAGHHVDVAACAAAISAVEDRPAPAMLLAAAFGHDLGYEPSPAPDGPFGREFEAARLLVPIWEGAGVADGEIERGHALVLATAPHVRGWLRSAGQADADEPPLPLLILDGDAELLRLARILSDADLAPSAGFSPVRAREHTARLSLEVGRQLGDADTLAFLDGLVGKSFLSEGGKTLFDCGLRRIRAELNGRGRATSAGLAD